MKKECSRCHKLKEILDDKTTCSTCHLKNELQKLREQRRQNQFGTMQSAHAGRQAAASVFPTSSTAGAAGAQAVSPATSVQSSPRIQRLRLWCNGDRQCKCIPDFKHCRGCRCSGSITGNQRIISGSGVMATGNANVFPTSSTAGAAGAQAVSPATSVQSSAGASSASGSGVMATGNAKGGILALIKVPAAKVVFPLLACLILVAPAIWAVTHFSSQMPVITPTTTAEISATSTSTPGATPTNAPGATPTNASGATLTNTSGATPTNTSGATPTNVPTPTLTRISPPTSTPTSSPAYSCGQTGTSFDLSGEWDLNFTVDTFTGPFTWQILLNFTRQSEGVFVSANNMPASAPARAQVFSARSPLTPQTPSCLLTTISMVYGVDKTSSAGLPYYGSWSGSEQFDLSDPMHPKDTGVVQGYWADIEMNVGRFELRKHASSGPAGTGNFSAQSAFDLRGDWDLSYNYTLGHSLTSSDPHILLHFTQQSDGVFLASTDNGSFYVQVLSGMRPPSSYSPPELLVVISITQENAATPYYASWSGRYVYDISDEAHPKALDYFHGYWTNFQMQAGQFELRRHTP